MHGLSITARDRTVTITVTGALIDEDLSLLDDLMRSRLMTGDHDVVLAVDSAGQPADVRASLTTAASRWRRRLHPRRLSIAMA